jgi:hypothetical protein
MVAHFPYVSEVEGSAAKGALYFTLPARGNGHAVGRPNRLRLDKQPKPGVAIEIHARLLAAQTELPVYRRAWHGLCI